MNYITAFYNFISARFESIPPMYGTFHLVSFAIVILLSVLACVFLRNMKDKPMRVMLFICWMVILGLEVLDQFVDGTTVLESGVFEFSYQWYRFPFQLCSTALWILPLIILIPEGKIRDGLIGYMTLFSFFGGVAVMFFPSTVFTNDVITCVHTMVHHGMQVVLGVFFISHERKKYNLRYFAGGVISFLVLLGIASVLNEVAHELFAAFGASHEFNMFYISPYYKCTLPVLSVIYDLVPYPVFFIIYCLGFIFISFIIYFFGSLANYIAEKIRHGKEEVKA